MSTILSLESEIDNVCRLARRRLDDMATKGETVNLQHWTAYFAFDVVCTLGIGGPLGFIEQGIDVKGIIKSIHDLFFMSSIFGDIPGQMVWLRNPISQALSRLAGHTSSNAGRDFAIWLFSQVQSRLQAPSDLERRPDMLDHFISMKEADGRPVDFPGVVVEAGNLIGAGADTTAAGISSVLGELVRHPEDYKAVQREVDEIYARGDIQAHCMIDYKTAEKLPWLSACVKEALRLTPSIVWQLPRHVPDEGITIDGHYIPASAVVSLSPYAANRDEIVFGDDASEWNPGRYIPGNKGVTDEYVRNIEKFDTTFGYGSRTCIGRNLALVETYRFVVEFCHRYDVAPVNAAVPYRTISQWFVVNKDFNVVLKRRQSVKK
ncbi:hypothetical protein CBER1_04919 [Cercospora berteroae]|uniref:Cytochrome P450 n=1 Tax=Cercospora berteroae TaxID=357750 RepID=A0A2S6CJE0_9PEZI|nr:hypothetical protein CBER1_04919 [Cercospora berteroae]